MSELERNVDRILSGRDAQEKAEAVRLQAIESAKPVAFVAFAATCAEAAAFLAKKGVDPETRKQAVVGHRKERRPLSRKLVDVPTTQPVSGWILHQARKTVNRGGPSYYHDPSWLAGMMFDTEGRLYRFGNDSASLLTSFDEAVEAIGSTNAFTLRRVGELQSFWELKVTKAAARIVAGEPPSTY